jgi:hypothetical protein
MFGNTILPVSGFFSRFFPLIHTRGNCVVGEKVEEGVYRFDVLGL